MAQKTVLDRLVPSLKASEIDAAVRNTMDVTVGSADGEGSADMSKVLLAALLSDRPQPEAPAAPNPKPADESAPAPAPEEPPALADAPEATPESPEGSPEPEPVADPAEALLRAYELRRAVEQSEAEDDSSVIAFNRHLNQASRA